MMMMMMVKKFPTVIREVLEGSMGQPYAGPNHPNITMLADNNVSQR